MPEVRHCRHCLGNCPGDCLIGDTGRCLHGWNDKPPRQLRRQTALTRMWWHRVWHRVFWGTR